MTIINDLLAHNTYLVCSFSRKLASTLPHLVHTECGAPSLRVEAVVVIGVIYTVEIVAVVIPFAFLRAVVVKLVMAKIHVICSPPLMDLYS